MSRFTFQLVLVFNLLAFSAIQAEEKSSSTPEFHKDIMPVLTKYCLGCHTGSDAEGEVNFDDYSSLLKKHNEHHLVKPGSSAKSFIIQLIEKTEEPAMPPEDEPQVPKKDLEILKRWIEAGAKAPKAGDSVARIMTPKIPVVGIAKNPVNSIALSPNGQVLAVAKYGVVEIQNAKTRKQIHQLQGHSGNVNRVLFSNSGDRLFAAAGEPGLYGEVKIWDTKNWKLIRTIKGHNDSLYALAVSPNGKILATGGYNQEIYLWNLENGKQLNFLKGHNGAINDLEFRPDGKMLASASGDRTIKLWDVATGKRLDTFIEPTKDQQAVTFTRDGQHIVAGGNDNRVRIWKVSQSGKPGSNELLFSRFAHQAPIIAVELSADGKYFVTSSEDRKLKLWETKGFTQVQVLASLSDWAPDLAISPNGNQLLAGLQAGEILSFPIKVDSTKSNEKMNTSGNVISKVANVETVKDINEVEPNQKPATATVLSKMDDPIGRLKAKGTIFSKGSTNPDYDLYEFASKKGMEWSVEILAARNKSPLDSKIEVLDSKGNPIERIIFRSVRDSYVTFRSIDSKINDVRCMYWQEMKLRQYFYSGGEVNRIYALPQGPDSGFKFFSVDSNVGGGRRTYFDTSGITHAVDDPCYIVEPFEPGTKLLDNGLPVFKIYYENDDDSWRRWGKDSRLIFTAPADGKFLVKVSDLRGFHGKDFKYELTVRPTEPSYDLIVSNLSKQTLNRGSGTDFLVKAVRNDGFDGPIQVEIKNMPDGLKVTSPILIQEGYLSGDGVISVEADAKEPTKEQWEKVEVVSSAMIKGQKVSVKAKSNFGKLVVKPQPKMVPHLLPDDGTTPSDYADGRIPEVVVVPGTEHTTAMLMIDRHDFKGEMKFLLQNLPHGIIVDNIGLSGILIRQGEEKRQIYLKVEPWVKEQTRLVHAITKGVSGKGEGKQATKPILLRVQKKSTATKTAAR